MTRNPTHRYIDYSDCKPLIAESNKLLAYIINWYQKTDNSVSKLKKLRQFTVTWKDKAGDHKGQFQFENFVEQIRTKRTYPNSEYDLPDLKCEWLDSSMQIALPNQLGKDPSGKGITLCLELPYGPTFPIKPAIDRTGIATTSFQGLINRNIVRQFHELITTSHEMLELNHLWLNRFRQLLNDLVSIVDVTLHQLYFMAEYRGTEKGWKFDAAKLGNRHGTRLKDKLKWIHAITGKALDDAQIELESFKKIKQLRNHFNHFDPPCFAITLPEIVEVLNLVPDIGRLLWKIRSKLGSQLSTQIVEIITLPVAVAKYTDPEAYQGPVPDDVGYGSCLWPEQNEHSD